MTRQLLLDLKPAPPSLDNFVAGGNDELLARLRDLARPGHFDVVYVWGPTGSGKSHLLGATARLTAGRRGLTELRGTAVGADIGVAPGGLLVIDDVDALGEAAQIALFRVFNTARLIGLSLLLSGSAPPLRLGLREDLRTRIGQSLIFEVKPLTEDERQAALRRHAMLRGMRVDDGLVTYLLRHGRRDLPSLMAVLDGLDRATLEQQRHATLPLLREVMQLQLAQPDEPSDAE